jgi:hypothetical protein
VAVATAAAFEAGLAPTLVLRAIFRAQPAFFGELP